MELTDCNWSFTFWSHHPSLQMVFPPHHSPISQTGIQQGNKQ